MQNGTLPAKPPIVLSYGLGLESTAILARWLLEPSSRDFDLDQIAFVVTAMLGSEFPDTIELVETHILPLLRQHRVRYAQVARAANSQTEGIDILSDTREPTRLHAEGSYRLLDEMLTSATIPQVGGTRLCSVKNKGYTLDAFIDQQLHGRPYRHVIGFNVEEQSRILRDRSFGGSDRNVWYPLDEWGWARSHCTEFLRDAFGVEDWPKSCCEFCVFTMGRPDILARYRKFPESAALALFAEMIARAFNPTQLLYKSHALLDKLRQDGNEPALTRFHEMLDQESWRIYRLRRLWYKTGKADRCVEPVSEVLNRSRALATLRDMALHHNAELSPTEDGLTWRVFLIARDESYEGRQKEDALILAPSVVEGKVRYDNFARFDERWNEWDAAIDLFASV